MEKIDVTKQFACRLREALIKAGHSSQRSASGVSIQKLAEICGYSLQICRKYLRGQAIPEPAKLIDIAAQLRVSPGWLLFGDCHQDPNNATNTITISKTLLHYIFTHAHELYTMQESNDEIPDYLLDLTNDVSQIEATEEQSKKIIDLALASVRHFNHPQGGNKK